MKQTTITINGEECVILPAPKGAFVVGNGYNFPYFVLFVAVPVIPSRNYNSWDELNVYPLSHYPEDNYVRWQGDGYFYTDVDKIVLHNLYDTGVEQFNDFKPKDILVMLYQMFKSHGTPMDDTAIKWFKEKFKEHNITKADFDVFA